MDTPSTDTTFPPGTIHIQDLQLTSSPNANVIPYPQPSEDPNDPLNWKQWEKTLNFTLVLLYALIIYALISVATPTWGPMNLELGFSYGMLTNTYALGTAMLAVGAILFIPFALKFGRRPIYLASLILQLAIGVWAANIHTSVDVFLVNALNCLVGSLADIIVQMTIADVYFVHQRGFMNSLYVWVILFGSSMAPLASGYIAQSQGWRWVWWWVTIILAITMLTFFFLYEETMWSAQGLVGISATELAEIGSHEDVPSQSGGELEKIDSKPKDYIQPQITNTQETIARDTSTKFSCIVPRRKSYLAKLSLFSSSTQSWKSLISYSLQPLVVLCTIPPILYAGMIYGIVTAAFQICITVMSGYMPLDPYNFSSSQIGLMSIPPFIGTTLGAALNALISDRIILVLAKRNQGMYEPEMRLWLALAFTPLAAAGLLIFGIALAQGSNWLVVAVGAALFTFAMTPCTSAVLTYITDSYTEIVADAMVGILFLRNVIATVFVFSITPWTNRVGLKNVFVTYSVITTALLLSTIGFLVYGRSMRAYTAARYRVYASRRVGARDS